MAILRKDKYIRLHFNEQEIRGLIGLHIRTPLDLVLKDAFTISQKSNIPYKKLVDAQESLSNAYSTPIKEGCLVEKEMRTKRIVHETGDDRLNELLSGGFQSGEVIEIIGKAGSGKTQLCLSVLAHMKDSNNVLYINTEASFSLERLTEIINQNNIPMEICKRIHVANVFSIFEIFDIFDQLMKDLKKPDSAYNGLSLIVIDNPALLILGAILPKKRFKLNNKIVVHFCNALKYLIAIKPELAVILTNTNFFLFGFYWDNTIIKQIRLVEHNKNQREMIVIKDYKEIKISKIGFCITSSGLKSLDC